MARTKAVAKQVLSNNRTKIDKSADNAAVAVPGKRRRWRSGRRALQTIRKVQKDCRGFWIGRLPLDRIIREIVKELNIGVTCLQPKAVDMLRASCDELLTDLFRAGNLIAVKNKRQTLSLTDFKLACTLMCPLLVK